MANLSIEIRPCLSQALPAGWGGPRISGPRLDQLLWKFATQHLNVALSPDGAVRSTAWTRQRASDNFCGDRRRQAQGALGPADGVLLEFQGGTVKQAGDTLTISSRYVIENADLSAASGGPEIGPDRQAIIERGLRAAVGRLIPEDLKSETRLSCAWSDRSMILAISLPV